MKKIVLFSDREEIKKCIQFLKERKLPIHSLISNSLKQEDFDIPVKKILDNDNYSNSILISYYYSKLIPESIFTQFSQAINFHPAPMPYYRGVKCGVFAIVNNEKKFGVTCHEINTKFDHGKILGQIEFALVPSETGFSLYNKSKQKLFILFQRYIDKIFFNTKQDVFTYLKNISYKSKKHSYYSNVDFEKLKCLDGVNIKSKKVSVLLRALWTPNYLDAFITNDKGEKIYLTIKNTK